MTRNNSKNKYLKYARISNTQFRALLREFCFDSTATETTIFSGEVEIDESYFGARWKTPVNGLILNRYKHKRVCHSNDEFVRGKVM